nr:MAG TPA: hypothetical protein [Caudoviricetes sp.]
MFCCGRKICHSNEQILSAARGGRPPILTLTRIVNLLENTLRSLISPLDFFHRTIIFITVNKRGE